MPNRQGLVAVFASAVLLAACHSAPIPPPPAPAPVVPAAVVRPAFVQVGYASWYGPHFNGKHTANGERFDMHALTAAHRTLPINSYVRVTNLTNHRSVVVRINDRGPYAANRIIDLSAEAARELGIRKGGVARVRIELMTADEASDSRSR
ncbi:MAG TPA: septal ring lytic transglycosylase RlpA family protein [Stellaceae bacterium]|nr:septal ring lytic transglycosylase RlpA family protein [Stellaceae bacterium]